MSKAKLIKLINFSDSELSFWLEEVPTSEARKLFRLALKEQDRDTRHGCAEAVAMLNIDLASPIINDAHDACMNYQDKELAEL